MRTTATILQRSEMSQFLSRRCPTMSQSTRHAVLNGCPLTLADGTVYRAVSDEPSIAYEPTRSFSHSPPTPPAPVPSEPVVDHRGGSAALVDEVLSAVGASGHDDILRDYSPSSSRTAPPETASRSLVDDILSTITNSQTED